MIQVFIRKGLLCSHFVCDVCHEPILDASKALIAMPDCFACSKEPLRVYHVHKGICQRQLEAESPRNYGDLEMRDHIVSLLVNIGWKQKDWKRAMDSYANMFTSEVAKTG